MGLPGCRRYAAAVLDTRCCHTLIRADAAISAFTKRQGTPLLLIYEGYRHAACHFHY